MEEVVWNVNGQGEFDFDYLLNLTNQEFVECVEKSITDFQRNVTVKVQVGDQIKVFVADNNFVHIHVFSKMLQARRSYFLNKHEIDWISEVMRNEN